MITVTVKIDHERVCELIASANEAIDLDNGCQIAILNGHEVLHYNAVSGEGVLLKMTS